MFVCWLAGWLAGWAFFSLKSIKSRGFRKLLKYLSTNKCLLYYYYYYSPNVQGVVHVGTGRSGPSDPIHGGARIKNSIQRIDQFQVPIMIMKVKVEQRSWRDSIVAKPTSLSPQFYLLSN